MVQWTNRMEQIQQQVQYEFTFAIPSNSALNYLIRQFVKERMKQQG